LFALHATGDNPETNLRNWAGGTLSQALKFLWIEVAIFQSPGPFFGVVFGVSPVPGQGGGSSNISSFTW
jgi:hypothetical protein